MLHSCVNKLTLSQFLPVFNDCLLSVLRSLQPFSVQSVRTFWFAHKYCSISCLSADLTSLLAQTTCWHCRPGICDTFTEAGVSSHLFVKWTELTWAGGCCCHTPNTSRTLMVLSVYSELVSTHIKLTSTPKSTPSFNMVATKT